MDKRVIFVFSMFAIGVVISADVESKGTGISSAAQERKLRAYPHEQVSNEGKLIAPCRNASDEMDCQRVCPSGEFQCADGHCIPSIRRCDRRPDCRDASDEIDCPRETGTGITSAAHERRLKAYPSEQVIKEGDDVDFLCRDESSSGVTYNITWERASNLPLPPVSSINFAEGRLHIEHIRKNQEGEYICKTIGGWPPEQISVTLIVEERTTVRPPHRITSCNEDQTTCSDGQCIEKFQLCDHKADCTDGSDEKHCDICEPDEFRCDNGRCVQFPNVCDGENDCGDGSDELAQNCERDKYAFECFNGSQSIPRGFHCDFNVDCGDGSDEIGCSTCTIIRHTPRNVELPVGAKFEISCQAVGVPTPRMVFRHNWRHVPPQCKVTSVDGVGTLTCPSVASDDSGAYSCECINNRGRAFGTDTILMVTGEQCPRGQYDSADGCASCFCFGVTNECQNANLYTYQIQPRSFFVRVVNVMFDPQMNMKVNELPALQSLVRVSNSSAITIRGYDILTLSPLNEYQYLALPESFLSDQLKSYGGYIKYGVRYEGFGQPIVSPSLILSGNGHVLLYFDSPLQSREERQESVRIVYGSWYKLNKAVRITPGNPFPRVLASRQEIMATLARLDAVLLKAQYLVSRDIETNILNFKFDTAGPNDVGQGKAGLVEECRCPDGYTGLSCENCAPGYRRVPGGLWSGQCRRPHESCEPGTYGDPMRGCLPCPCPLTTPPNKFSPTCSLDTDGQPACNACPIGYGGRRCEYCTAGFVGNPLVLGGSCQPSERDGSCFAGYYQIATAYGKECRKCPCNDHEEGCFANADGRVTCNCRIGYIGSKCEAIDSSAPKIVVTPETANGVYEFITGDAVAINCEATGTPVPTLEWLKESESFRKVQTGTKSVTLRISTVSKSDEGTYVCRARNNVGSSFEQVSIVVRGLRPTQPKVPAVRVNVWPANVNGSVGETVRLNCISAPSNNNTLKWARADNASLPRTAEQRAGLLTIRNADSSASGVYVCNAVSVLTNDIISNAFVTVNIAESNALLVPTLAIDPERQTVAQGSLAVIRCTSPTHPRAAVKWRKVGDEFSSHVEISNNEIRIPSAAVEDRGIYICEYENAAGAALVRSVLEIDRREPPVVQIYPESQQKIETGGSTFIQCRVLQGIPSPKIRWLRRGQRVSSPHVIETEGILRFTKVTDEDDGEYTCSAENAAGRVDATAALKVISRPVITVLPEEEMVLPSHVDANLSCLYDGWNASNKNISYEWEREDGRAFSSRVDKRQNTLLIHRVEHEDSGRYKCAGIDLTAGYELFSKTIDLRIMANVTKKSVKYGHNVDLVCDTHLDPPVNYSWVVHTYAMSMRKIVANTRTLSVMDATVNDSGIYFCKAVSVRGSFCLPTVLIVEHENVIPAFAGNSYITLPSIVKSSAFVNRNDIEIHFKPTLDNGLILFNALRRYPTWGYRDDFMSFGLNGGFPEFRYEVGSGFTTVIRGNAPLQMNKWHEVVLSRNQRDGFMQINGIANFTGSYVGQYNEPNLKVSLFIGGHSDYTNISRLTKFNSGFKGCIGRLRIDLIEINLKKEAQLEKNVKSCDSNCDPNPCLNDGFCQETSSFLGYHYCICRPGYSGDNCQLKNDTRYAALWNEFSLTPPSAPIN